jgi:hypothetical protein
VRGCAPERVCVHDIAPTLGEGSNGDIEEGKREAWGHPARGEGRWGTTRRRRWKGTKTPQVRLLLPPLLHAEGLDVGGEVVGLEEDGGEAVGEEAGDGESAQDRR